jgi:biopolymer transport protein ExbD
MKFLHRRRQAQQQIDLNVIPLIDVVFFLLIFYVISTSFMQESAVTIKRPSSTQATTLTAGFVPVAIVKSGAIHIGPQVVELRDVQSTVAASMRSANATSVLVIPDREVPTGLLLQVMDACTAAGATSVDVAATKE